MGGCPFGHPHNKFHQRRAQICARACGRCGCFISAAGATGTTATAVPAAVNTGEGGEGKRNIYVIIIRRRSRTPAFAQIFVVVLDSTLGLTLVLIMLFALCWCWPIRYCTRWGWRCAGGSVGVFVVEVDGVGRGGVGVVVIVGVVVWRRRLIHWRSWWCWRVCCTCASALGVV